MNQEAAVAEADAIDGDVAAQKAAAEADTAKFNSNSLRIIKNEIVNPVFVHPPSQPLFCRPTGETIGTIVDLTGYNQKEAQVNSILKRTGTSREMRQSAEEVSHLITHSLLLSYMLFPIEFILKHHDFN